MCRSEPAALYLTPSPHESADRLNEERMTMPDSARICAASEVPQQGAKGLEVNWGERRISLILLWEAGELRGYLNSCPHTGVRLEWRADDFFDSEGQHLQCTTHDARFRPGDGHCVAGPCKGQSLVAAPLVIEDGEIRLLSPDSLPRSARRR